MSTLVTRFAPSPTGHLHIGGARTALFSWLLARHAGGSFRLRIEDTDTERSKQEYTDSILASMRWLGLDWDDELVYQKDRTERYNEAIEQLLANGYAYWCSCTPEEVEAMREEARTRGEKPRYDGRCATKNLGCAPGSVVRLKRSTVQKDGAVYFDDMVKGALAVDIAELDDMILRRSDGMPTYNLAVVVDDHDMGVTHVIRGDDHVANTPKQILLYKALGWELPIFGHVPMILGADRQKLSKRHGARAVVEYQEDGLLPQALVNCLVRLGWSHGDQELFTLDELVQFFDGTSLNRSASAFDPEKLQWYNAQYLRETPIAQLTSLVEPFVHTAAQAQNLTIDLTKLADMVVLYRERASNLVDLAKMLLTVLLPAERLEYDSKAVAKQLTVEGCGHLNALKERFAALESFVPETIETALGDYVAEQGVKFKFVASPLRVALMGSMSGPHLPEVMSVMGKDATLARLDKAITLTQN